MATAAEVRKLLLSMPEAEQKSHFGQPDFRVRNKIFASMSPKGERATLKLNPEAQAMLLDARPEAFIPAAGAWGRGGWTYVVLAEVTVEELRDLVAEAWRLVAPKRLVEAHGGGAGPAKTDRGGEPPGKPKKKAPRTRSAR